MPKRWRRPVDLQAEFLCRLQKTSKCWLWTQSINSDGYGMFFQGRRECGSLFAHRFAVHFFRAPIPTGLVVDHICRVRRCVNPAHLRVVTWRENVRCGEGVGVRNARKQNCPTCGGPYTQRTATERRCVPCDRLYRRDYMRRRRAAARIAK